MRILLIVLASSILGTGCTAVTVKPVDPTLAINYVCIENNSKVIERFRRRLEGWVRQARNRY